jgi:hypothetical protein
MEQPWHELTGNVGRETNRGRPVQVIPGPAAGLHRNRLKP